MQWPDFLDVPAEAEMSLNKSTLVEKFNAETMRKPLPEPAIGIGNAPPGMCPRFKLIRVSLSPD
jgi:hypothetical protein